MMIKWLPVFLLVSCASDHTLYPVEGFTLREGDSVEILVSIDISGSMSAGGWFYSTFTTQQVATDLALSGIDWNLAMITTDPKNLGWFEVDTSNTNLGWSIAEGLTNLQTSSGWAEQGLDALLSAKEENSSWFRSDKTILLVYSDEPDQSEILLEDFWPQWADPALMVAVTPSPSEVTATIDGFNNSSFCTTLTDTRYYQTAHHHIEICDPNPWSILDFIHVHD